MPHIPLVDGVPGIRSAFLFSPETARPMLALAEVLLRGVRTLSRAVREMIAARWLASQKWQALRWETRAAAAHHLDGDYGLVDAVIADPAAAPISPKFRRLLDIAALVAAGGSQVTETAVAPGRRLAHVGYAARDATRSA